MIHLFLLSLLHPRKFRFVFISRLLLYRIIITFGFAYFHLDSFPTPIPRILFTRPFSGQKYYRRLVFSYVHF